MSSIEATDLSNLMIARRLMEFEKNAKARRDGKHVEEKSMLDYYEEDQAIISGTANAGKDHESIPSPSIENINIQLSDLPGSAKDRLNTSAQAAAPVKGNNAQQDFVVDENQTVDIELEMRYRSNAPMEGLVVHDQNYAESDRYLFKFADGATFTILDKWTNKSTTIWGDPHVDVDDVAGNGDGDFKDLKSSEDFTTFMLGDGTRVTFKAKDAGLIEQVDILKGSQHIKGVGSAAKEFSSNTGLFSNKVLNDGILVADRISKGDVVFAGGDGNDWFDASNKLIWGKTTGPVITQRPPAVLEFYYKQTVSQSVTVQTIAKTA